MEFTPQQSASTSRLKLCKEYFPMSPDIFNETDSDQEESSLADGSANSCSSNQTSEDIEDNEVAFLRRRIQVLEIENRSLYRKIDDMEKKEKKIAEHNKVNVKRPRTSHLLVPFVAGISQIPRWHYDKSLFPLLDVTTGDTPYLLPSPSLGTDWFELSSWKHSPISLAGILCNTGAVLGPVV